MMPSPDQLQNEVLTIAHHLDDIEKSLKDGDIQYALEGLKDAREAIQRLNHFLPQKLEGEMDRMAEGIIRSINKVIGENNKYDRILNK